MRFYRPGRKRIWVGEVEEAATKLISKLGFPIGGRLAYGARIPIAWAVRAISDLPICTASFAFAVNSFLLFPHW